MYAGRNVVPLDLQTTSQISVSMKNNLMWKVVLLVSKTIQVLLRDNFCEFCQICWSLAVKLNTVQKAAANADVLAAPYCN